MMNAGNIGHYLISYNYVYVMNCYFEDTYFVRGHSRSKGNLCP